MNNANIALVEDDQLVRQATSNLLRSLGYTCKAFMSAEDFLGSDVGQYDCIISDIQMSGISGLSLAQTIRDSDEPIPVILFTAYPDEKAGMLRDDGVISGLLEKPVSSEELSAALEIALGVQGRN